jgi:hypothetical protein
MKRIRLALIALLISLSSYVPAQVASSCTMPQVLRDAYRRDIANLATRAMYLAQSPDTQLVAIPTTWSQPIADGIAAVFNATSILERDSVFDIYCVHDRTGASQMFQSFLIKVDTSYAWTQAWQNLTTLTGNAPLDHLLQTYDLHVAQFYNWPLGNYAVLETDSVWNNRALLALFGPLQGILETEVNASIGLGGRITFEMLTNDRYIDFYHEFGDCSSGCIDRRIWHFKVSLDCSVTYLGFDDSSPFGFNPLPDPSNCNLTTNIAVPMPMLFQVYPNPAPGQLQITAPKENALISQAALYDMQGRKLLLTAKFTDQVSIDLREFAHGIYSLVILQQGKVVEVKRIVH